jgi:hypothetical protein
VVGIIDVIVPAFPALSGVKVIEASALVLVFSMSIGKYNIFPGNPDWSPVVGETVIGPAAIPEALGKARAAAARINDAMSMIEMIFLEWFFIINYPFSKG